MIIVVADIQGFDAFLNLVIEGGIEVVKREDQVFFGSNIVHFLKKVRKNIFHPEREERDWNGGDPGQKCGVPCRAGASPVNRLLSKCRVVRAGVNQCSVVEHDCISLKISDKSLYVK